MHEQAAPICDRGQKRAFFLLGVCWVICVIIVIDPLVFAQ